MLNSKAKIILKSWSLSTEYGSGMHIKHYLSISTDILFLVSTLSALWEDVAIHLEDVAIHLGSSEVEGGESQWFVLIGILWGL